ncbi:MAG: hypothetical protein QG570_628 [Patescibacteria group bacterium]|nr:hypothetical protein [Patescibacteria group bacterium]
MDLKTAKVAIVQDYLHVYGGAEAVVNAIWELFPQADIYSATYDAEVMKKAGVLQGARIFYPKWKDNIPGKFKKFAHKLLVANLPFYFENLDLSQYDLIISSSAHFAKGVKKTRENQIHVSYIHTPPRFLYGLPGEIRKRTNPVWKLILSPLDSYLRYKDKQFAQRPDYLLCNSETVKDRIKKYYNRDATVINPFPEITVSYADFEDSVKYGDYFLVISRLEAYKNVELIIKTFSELGLPLKVAGKGSEYENLLNLSKNYSNIEMLGYVSSEEKFDLLKKCKAFIIATEDEDFGMSALEPMMFGKPVIAYRSGGLKEIVKEKENGLFFDELVSKSLGDALGRVQKIQFDSISIRNYAQKFSKENFKNKFMNFLEDQISRHI